MSLSLVKISARLVDIWRRYLNFLLESYLWDTLYIQMRNSRCTAAIWQFIENFKMKKKEFFFTYKVLIFWMIRFFPSPVLHALSLPRSKRRTRNPPVCFSQFFMVAPRRITIFFSYIYSAPFLDEASFSVTSSLLFLYLQGVP